MQIVPHIDIVEPERIDHILADPASFVWRAVDSETLDTWAPDLGLSNYPHPSIVRRGSVATSGIPSTLRHRFWETVEQQRDHTGVRYIGILLYDKLGQPSPMELRLAANEIGRIEPTRQDNRRHLLVVDKPVEFIGEMEIFQLTAPNAGEYRIEQFILIKERPVPSQFNPQIEHLSAVATPASVAPNDEQWQATLHFTTTEAAICSIDVVAPGQPPCKRATTDPKTLHRIELPSLAPGCTYTATVTATEKAGSTATASTQFRTGTDRQSTSLEISVPVELCAIADQDLAGYPLTFGVPLPRGRIFAPQGCTMQLANAKSKPQTGQVRVHARWPDQSARWALIDTVVPSAVPAGRSEPKQQAEVIVAEQPLAESQGLACHEEAGAITITSTHLRVTVRTGTVERALHVERRGPDGDWQTIFPPAPGEGRPGNGRPGKGLHFETVLGNGVHLATGSLAGLCLEENGSQRAVVRFTLDHCDADGTAHLRSTMRLHIYADQPFIKLVHRLSVISPMLAPAAAGGRPQHSSVDPALYSAVVGEDGETSTLLKLRSFGLHWPWESTTVQAIETEWPITAQAWQLTHEHDLGHLIQTVEGIQRVDGRCAGHINIGGEEGPLQIGVRNFWQTYPKGLKVASDGVTIELFPQLTGEPLPGDEEAWHRLYFWLRDGCYLLKAGMALSSEVLIGFNTEQDAIDGAFAWFEEAPVVRPTTAYLADCAALDPVAAKADSLLPSYETLVDEALDSFGQDRQHFRAYGQLNFGDWYGESGWSWGNNEYDPAYCAYIEFLRGGAPQWAAWGAEATRHVVDVDTINYSAAPDEIGGQAMHMPGHLGGYLPPLFRSKMGGTKSIPSHIWVEGPLLHYLLTGDESVLETIQLTKAWLLQDRWFDNYDFNNCREAGWHLIHLCMLASATNDPHCGNAASIIVRRVLEREEPDGGWVHMLTESHCGCGFPRCRGEAGFMVGVLLSGLKRYHNLTQDERVAQAIIGGARWLIEHTFDAASGHFRYTSCANRTLGGGFQQTQWVLEGLTAAYELSGDREIGQYVKRGLDAIGLFPAGLDHLGLGKALSQQMRYVPTLLAALEKQALIGNR